jgi:spectinomycin phosphotransferase
MLARTEELAQLLCQHPHELVLFHSDAHPGNYLTTESGVFFLVDWDNPIFTPMERNRMFFGSGMAGDQTSGWEEGAFYQGYAQVEVDLCAIAYYRYERIIQDIAEFCKHLLLSYESGEDREQAYLYLIESFLPGHVVEAAFKTDSRISQLDKFN